MLRFFLVDVHFHRCVEVLRNHVRPFWWLSGRIRIAIAALEHEPIDRDGHAISSSILSVCQFAHLADGVAPQGAGGHVERRMPVDAMTNVDGDTPTQPVNQTAAQRYEQQLGLLADEDRQVALDQISPNDIVGPLIDRRARMRPRWGSRGRRR